MGFIPNHTVFINSWLEKEAFPLWSGVGLDHRTRTVWEALDHSGQPCRDMNRRLRVQVRQAYCFARSGRDDLIALGSELFRFSMDHGFDPVTGNLAALLDSGTRIIAAPHDLYDMAFMFLAAAALIEIGCDVRADLKTLDTALARLKADRGWYENAAKTLPRRQNPHMHLFEASTALYRTTGQKQYLNMAQECLGLFKDVFFQVDGHIFELFDADWSGVPGCQQMVEPGHMAEWIYLLDQYEQATGQNCGVDLELLTEAMLMCRDSIGALPDIFGPASKTRRSWPQTELLKSVLVMQARGAKLPKDAMPDVVLDMLLREYLTTDVSGGWYDKRNLSGVLQSDNMPASTFYHILGAFECWTNHAQGHRSRI